MTKQEYIKSLEDKLSVFDAALAKEIIEDYEGHFRDGRDNGRTEEEICTDLGNIDEIIEELQQLYQPKRKEESNFQETVNDVMHDALNIANDLAGTIVKGIKSGIDYGKRTWYEKTKEDVVDAQCTRETHNSCKKAVIDGDCASVAVVPGDNEEFHVEYINHGSLKDKILYRFQGEQVGDTFYGKLIKEKGNTSLFQMMNNPHIEIIVKVPQTFDDIEVSCSSGDITLNDVALKSIKLNGASGDILVDSIKANNVAMDNASGHMVISNAYAKVFRLKSKSGDITINNSNAEEIMCKSKSGDIVGAEDFISNFNAEAESGCIDFEQLNAEIVEASTRSGDLSLKNSKAIKVVLLATSGDVRVEQIQAEKVEAGSVSGSIDIEIAAGNSGYTAEVNTISGNISMQMEGNSKCGMRGGKYTMGEGKSSIKANNVSGDIEIRG